MRITRIEPPRIGLGKGTAPAVPYDSLHRRPLAPEGRFVRLPKLLLLIAVACSSLACSPRDFLTRRLAANLISGSEIFKNPQVFWLRTGIVSNRDFNSPDSMVLQHRGWIIGTEKKCPPGVDPPPCWDVVLSPLGVDVFRPLVSDTSPGIGPMSLRVARRELVNITGISKAGTFADVEFTWRWVSLNPVGAALYDEGVHYRSTVAFRSYDDGWRVVNETVKPNQSLEEALRNAEPTAP
ncbi:MAG: hypothetical protein LAO56_01590 [Acidobacteriia bacterium]|nr:hypothetical protein [Terriglobia bacterium]